jgi:hypothetical protein
MKLRAVLKTIALCATMALAGTSRAQELASVRAEDQAHH